MSRARVVVQSRLSSSRLPGKAMLSLAGMPLIELVGRRVRNTGHEVVVATSDEHYDGQIAGHLESVGIPVLRGSLDDVLGRFVAATADLAADDLVVRMTGDNPVADGALVDELIAAVRDSGHRYGRVDIDRVPEGIGAEVFTAGDLRRAAVTETDPYDREHVTPWLRRELGELLHVLRAAPRDLRRFRCTVDVLDDYDRVRRAFAAVDDPVTAPWSTLVRRLGPTPGAADDEPTVPVREPAGPSTVLLDLDASTPGAPVSRELRALLRVAVSRGITHVHTASTPGTLRRLRAAQEPALAQRLEVRADVSLSPTGGRPAVDPVPELVLTSTRLAVERAFADLGRRRISLLSLRPEDATAGDGAAWGELTAYQRAGEVGELGVVLRSGADPSALRLPGLAHVTVEAGTLDAPETVRALRDFRAAGGRVTVRGSATPPLHAALALPEVDSVAVRALSAAELSRALELLI